ncbi:uncharacterized protein Z520_08018 [Fonsecaea multimorphosa CBS 102226]|uniref:RNA polymerase II holoenzyme cyclin-like subunit n=1 Tax=Fonsecaea multimorphosa CBS 102226 TaxID=1442371 RepID=A0A0D2H313_9EURO|nr:uncharacterized protein Z520_08018 [Fonsecaea multimorphosa CBS 102226]KIX96240.1 hypothetical protein Z520_08018 [Fonsecaea multimorphosa CBS 102226]OAL21903.1 hypothetical protein AYO22_07500 [Fonsecaea multimorphosa]
MPFYVPRWMTGDCRCYAVIHVPDEADESAPASPASQESFSDSDIAMTPVEQLESEATTSPHVYVSPYVTDEADESTAASPTSEESISWSPNSSLITHSTDNDSTSSCDQEDDAAAAADDDDQHLALFKLPKFEDYEDDYSLYVHVLAPSFTPGFAESVYANFSFPQPPPPLCECGGISPHRHSEMNGAAGPTPSGEGTTASTSPNTSTTGGGPPKRGGPLPNHVQVAKSYVFEQEIQKCLKENGVSPAREDNIRLAGVQWIDNVRKALKLPVRTFNTAVVYYHKFRLQHSDGEYSFVDAAAAALFTACKIEDTLKKSRDILCAAHNLKAPRAEILSPDDQVFEHHSRTIIGLERLMLEASGFDFRNRHPQELLIKFAKHYSFTQTSPVVRTAYSISLDLYRTWAPLKQMTATLAFACLELAGRLLGEEHEAIWTGADYEEWRVERGMVMETLLDLLELYTHHRNSTAIGQNFPVDTFLEVRIPLNLESEEKNIPRYTAWMETDGTSADDHAKAGQGHHSANGTGTMNGSKSGSSSKNVSPRDVTSPRRGSASTTAPPGGAGNAAPGSGSGSGPVVGMKQRVGERGREGTVRFILNPDRERDEKAIVDLFRKA